MSGVDPVREQASPSSMPSARAAGDEDTQSSIPVLCMVKLFESKVAQDDDGPPPPPLRRRGSESNLPRTLEEKRKSREIKKLDDRPPAVVFDTSPPAAAAASTSSSARIATPFQLDLRPVFEQRDRGESKELHRSTSMRSLLAVSKGRPHSARAVRHTSSFREVVASPRTVRSFVPPEFGSLKPMDLSGIKVLVRKKSSFDKAVRRRMAADWNASSPKKMTFNKIEERVSQLCRVEIDRLFSLSDSPLSQDLHLTESPRAKAMVSLVQKSGFILFPIIERMLVLRQAVFVYVDLKKSITPRLQEFLNYMDRLTLQEHYSAHPSNFGLEKGKNLLHFMATWDEFRKNKEMRPFVPAVALAFGNTKKDRNGVIATLRKWCNPPSEIFLLMKTRVHKMDWENIAASNIPFFEHEWEEDKDAEKPISRIIPYEIVRCLHTGMAILPNRIVINGEVFYDTERDGDKDLPAPDDFLSAVIKDLHKKGLDPKIKDEEVEGYIKKINTWKSLPEREQKQIPDSEQFPCLYLMRLFTNSSWGHADLYIRRLFPGLFTIPYWTKPFQGLEHHVAISGPEDFSVQQKRSYVVYPRDKPDDPDSYTPIWKKPLLRIDFSWTMTPFKGRWSAILKIDGIYEYPDIGEHKWPLLHALINYQDQENPVEKSRAPGTPRMRSNPIIREGRLDIGEDHPSAPSSASSSSSSASRVHPSYRYNDTSDDDGDDSYSGDDY